MFNILQQIGNVIDCLFSLIELCVWLISGLDDLLALLSTALGSLTSVLDIFPAQVSAALMGVCGGLFILRVFGRS